MSGARRIFFASAAVLLRALAWLPFQVADGCIQLAALCEERARQPQKTVTVYQEDR